MYKTYTSYKIISKKKSSTKLKAQKIHCKNEAKSNWKKSNLFD